MIISETKALALADKYGTPLYVYDEKSGKNLKNELLSGLHVFSYMAVAQPKFQGQTKHKLMNTNIKKDIDNALLPALLKFQVSEKDVYSELVSSAAEKIKLINANEDCFISINLDDIRKHVNKLVLLCGINIKKKHAL